MLPVPIDGEQGKVRKMVEQLYESALAKVRPLKDDYGLFGIVVEFGAIGPDESSRGALTKAKAGRPDVTPQPVGYIPGSRIVDFYNRLEQILDGEGIFKCTPAATEVKPDKFYKTVTVKGPKGVRVTVKRENHYAYVAELVILTDHYVDVDLAVRDLIAPTQKDHEIYEINRYVRRSG